MKRYGNVRARGMNEPGSDALTSLLWRNPDRPKRPPLRWKEPEGLAGGERIELDPCRGQRVGHYFEKCVPHRPLALDQYESVSLAEIRRVNRVKRHPEATANRDEASNPLGAPALGDRL